MSQKRYTPAYPAELRDRGVRLFRDHRGEYASDNAAYRAIAPKLGGRVSEVVEIGRRRNLRVN
ncbi:hypothetical protein [Paracoccus yeei]|uniref:hypothetical protein n=1 Tax=Paracoccus yeei TaxID=147645 RepID=UPI003BF80BEE